MVMVPFLSWPPLILVIGGNFSGNMLAHGNAHVVVGPSSTNLSHEPVDVVFVRDLFVRDPG